MSRVWFNVIVELGILFSVIYIMVKALTTNDEVIEMICYCALTILAVVEWRSCEKSRSQSVTDNQVRK